MTDTFRALCAEQLPELRGMFERILCVARSTGGPTCRPVGNIELADRLIDAVVSWHKNSLAQPEPEGATDDELLNLGNDVMGDCLPCDPDLLLAFARATLARYARPAIEPVPEGPSLAHEAYIAFVQICKGNSDDAGTYEADEELVRRALKRLSDLEHRPAIKPVPDAKARELLNLLLDDLDALIDNSEGVTGLHLNGDVASWESLREGGTFETWLMRMDEARAFLDSTMDKPADACPAVKSVPEGYSEGPLSEFSDGGMPLG